MAQVGAAQQILWISHRGVSGAGCENTLPAFEAAVAGGFTALETDLQVTLDDHIVLSHDANLKRIGGGDIAIGQSTRADLAGITLPGGEKLLFLEQFIEAFTGCTWTFDVKPELGLRTVQVLLEWIRKRKFADWFSAQGRFLFWHPTHQEILCRELPRATCYAREPECWRAGLAALSGLPRFGAVRAGTVYSLPPKVMGLSLYNKRMMQSFHRQWARVLAFLPKSADDIEAALTAGADEILLDGPIPERYRPVMGQQHRELK